MHEARRRMSPAAGPYPRGSGLGGAWDDPRVKVSG